MTPPVKSAPAETMTHRGVLRRAAINAGTAGWEPPPAIQRSSSLTSFADCQRSSGSLARQFLTTRSSAGGDIGWIEEIGTGSLDMIAVMSDAWLVPENAF